MNKKLLNLSGKVDFLLNPLFEISAIAQQLNIPFFIIGATARDLILQYGYEIKTGRITYDLDIALLVKDWASFTNLANALMKTKKFKKDKNIQRIWFVENNLPIDLVPFGALSDQNGNIRWPPDYKTELNVLGFNEAWANAITILFSEKPHLKVKCASIAGLTLLKIISWRERKNYSQKDAQDIALFLDSYAEAGNMDRLYSEYSEVLKANSFDVEIAGAQLLGIDIAKIILPQQKSEVLQILFDEIDEEGQLKLINAMILNSLDAENAFRKKFIQLKKMLQGIEEG